MLFVPRKKRGVDHVRHAMATDRLDRQIYILQSEPVRRDLFQRKPFGCNLLECELARFETVPPSALHGNSFNGDFTDWEIRKIRHHASHNHASSAAPQAVHTPEKPHDHPPSS